MMKRYFFLLLFAVVSFTASATVNFDDWFENRTLRVDYIFAGDSVNQSLYVDELVTTPEWAGRRVNLDSLYQQGNGQIMMRDEATGKLIYCMSFSSLFQEWQSTREASFVRKSFENPFQLPMPKKPVVVTLTLSNSHLVVTSTLTHRVDPKDILIRHLGEKAIAPHRYLLQSGDAAKCIDVAIVAEGYTEAEMDSFYHDAGIAMDALFAHEPFTTYKNRFNVVAVGLPSQESGVSVPLKGEWKQTAVNSHFSTFYSDRYLTTTHLTSLHDQLSGIPYEHIIILANTDTYGGGGIYNSYMLTAARHSSFRPVVVHEFGHSFCGLADEYYYDDQYTEMYPKEVEPWEKNITTLVHFDRKWKNQLPKGIKIPTPPSKKEKDFYTRIGVFEGGGYQSKGVYRAYQECRMKINAAPVFCPVCRQAIEGIIKYYTGD